MWSSSSTTSTFCGLMAIAMPLEHQHACDRPIRKSARNCKKVHPPHIGPEVRFPGLGNRTSVQKCGSTPPALLVGRAEHDAERVAGEAEPLAQPVLQVA